MDNQDPFRRSRRTVRSPQRALNDSTVLDPNKSSCELCHEKDTLEMVECERCKGWHHFKCVGVDASIKNFQWICQACKQKSTPPTVTGSIRSSTSSKRRSLLQLEKLAKEKAIQDKLILEKARLAQQQANVDSEFLQKEYEILQGLTDSDDDDVSGVKASSPANNKNDLVKGWLEMSKHSDQQNLAEPTETVGDLLSQLNIKTREQMLQTAKEQIQSYQPGEVRKIQFLPTSSKDTSNDVVQINVQVPPDRHQSSDLSQQIGNTTNRNESTDPYVDRTTASDVNFRTSIETSPIYTSSTGQIDRHSQGTASYMQLHDYQLIAKQSQTGLLTTVLEKMSQQPPTSSSTSFVPNSTSFVPNSTSFVPNSTPFVPNSTPFVPNSTSFVPNSTSFVPNSTSFVPNSTSFVPNSTPFVPNSTPFVPNSTSFVPNSTSFVPNSTPFVPNSTSFVPNSTSFVPNSTSFVPNSTPFVPNLTSFVPNSTSFVPNVTSFTSSLYQQQYAPTSAQPGQFISQSSQRHQSASIPTQPQQSIPTSVLQQPITSFQNYQQPFMSIPNQRPQPIMNRPSQTVTNQWVTYDPQFNNQQLPPTKLQLAARQTMPKEYPKFNGDPEKWSIFFNAYANCTTTCGLSNGENLSRLEKCLEDPARKAIQNLLTRPEAVPEIIETLMMLYGRPEASIDSQLRVIRNEPPPKMNRMETFIDFAMSVRNVTSEIEKTGLWQYLSNPQLMQELVHKLPYQMRMEWGQVKIFTPNVSLSSFSEWLFLRARTACAVTLPSNTDKKSSSNSKSNSGGHINTHSKSNDAGKKPSANIPKGFTNSNTKTCNACNGKSHEIYECRKFLGMSLNDRWETVKSNKICRICLERHHALRCESNSLCGESGCTIKHHRLLHNQTKTVQTIDNQPTSKENVHGAHQQSKITILRRYIPVVLYGPKGSLNVLAFLDDGSDMTLIENQIVQKLGISGVPTDLFLEWTAKIVRKEQNSKSVTLKISGTRTGHKQYEIADARTVKSLDLPAQTVNIDDLRDVYKFLRRIPIESYTNEAPKILIGLRDCKLGTPLKTRSGEWHDPIATKTLLGWELHGSNAPPTQVANLNFHSSNETNNDDKLHQMVAQFFSLENFGVKKPEQSVEALSDKRARQLLASTTKRIGNKFETGLLWKYDNVSLPDSLPMAKRRLISLEKRLDKDPELAMKFRTKFHEYVEKGYARKLNSDEEAITTEKTWYLPLFTVTYPKKPNKIRLVWDAAAKVGDISLNSMLLSGPDLLVSLQGVLYRFRERAYVVTGDIREMFHQVMIRKEDQTSQQFLWRETGSSKIDVYILPVMSFGATCSPSSAQYVKNQNALEHIEQYPRAEKAIRENTYVDDWLQSFHTETEAENVAKEVTFVHSEGGFEIRNWLSNSPQVSRNLGASSDDEQKLSLDAEESQTERILGMWWYVKQDAFTYSLRYNPVNQDILMNKRRPTKRETLRTLMSIYDPLGFLASYLVHLKMILQDIWRTGISWDEPIKPKDDDDIYGRWVNWIKFLPEIENIRINRHYSPKINATNSPRIELHIFVDASELAYATVAYFRIEDQDGVECCLIGGKTKVAPLKPLSVPRMELQAAVLGSRFRTSILENHTLEVTRKFIWSDSTTVLSWLKSDLRKYTQYVGARIGEILETTALPEWRWVPSKLNPADDATKWKGSFNLDKNNRWFIGPDFLLQDEKLWPKKEFEVGETEEELRPKYVHAHNKAEIENLTIKFEEFLQWKRTMAFVFRFINNTKAKLGKPGFETHTGLLTRHELQEGECALYRKAQLDEFTLDIRKLRYNAKLNGNRRSVEKTSPLYRYSPYLDQNGVLRMKGRIDAVSNVSLDQKRPIILPTNHQITDLIVKECHIRFKHQNTETVVNEIKQKFVIPRLRVLLKKIRRSCQHCKNATAQPLPPEMAQLPIGRLASFSRPFTYTGVDYAGPFMITQFRRSVKRWIVIFTCLTIRAVYIDCVETLTTDSCIMAIRRFIARNGKPQEFFSDRGTNFVGTDNELAREVAKIDQELINITFTTCYTQWNFNPPYAQYMGGAWERLISSMKTTLDKILPKSHYPNHETLVTALAEVENIINSRPLTFVSIEPDDQEALTPNHFLKGSSNGNKPPGIFPPPPATLRGNWRYAQQIANEFWSKWVKEYLPMITRRTKWFDQVKPIEVGDQVIIVDENAPRNMWDRGVVIEATQSGQDGRISRVKVRTTDGIYIRPVSKLAVLDLSAPEAKTLTRESLAEGSVTASSDV